MPQSPAPRAFEGRPMPPENGSGFVSSSPVLNPLPHIHDRFTRDGETLIVLAVDHEKKTFKVRGDKGMFELPMSEFKKQ